MARAKERLPEGRPVLHLPHHLSLPLDPPPAREEARRALGLPQDALLLTSAGLATASKRLDAALAALQRLREAHPALRLIVAGAVDPGLPLHEWIAAARLESAVIITGRLSLDEFRVSMIGNRFVAWNSVPTDRNRDKLLSFDEFTFNHFAAEARCQ